MHYISLYTKSDIRLEDVAICAMKCGFKTYYLTQINPRIGIDYTFESEGEKRESAWQIWKPDVWGLFNNEPDLLAGKEPELLELLKPVSVFTIAYRTQSLPKLMVLMKGLLNAFGGWMVSHDTFEYLTEDDIDTFMKVSS